MHLSHHRVLLIKHHKREHQREELCVKWEDFILSVVDMNEE